MKKYYVLDTNILLQSPNAIYGFEDNTVVITGTTLQELDSKKILMERLDIMRVR
jgi:PhoH-like ATPase